MAAEIPEELLDNGMLETRTGYIPDLPDDRDASFVDQLYKELAATGVHLQAQSIQGVSPEVYNQYNLNSCVANAVAMALRYGEHKLHGKSADQSFSPSRLFIWCFGKYLGAEYAKKKDSALPGGQQAAKANVGSQIRNAIKAVHKYGACPDDRWPYPTASVELTAKGQINEIPQNVAWPPTDELMDVAKSYCNLKFRYFRIMTVAENSSTAQPDNTMAPSATAPGRAEQIRSCLSEGYPVIFAIKIFQKQDPKTSVWADSWNPTDWHNMVRNTTKISDQDGKEAFLDQFSVKEAPPLKDLGEWKAGHAMLVVGYHRDLPSDKGKRGMFLVQNSWGEGNLPYFWVPYSYFEQELVHDTWVIKIDGLLDASDDHRTEWDAPN